uniref:Uncharacterized protein n=1 Tax=Babesia bovis TaxID=5865 RepID=S6B879_BABBO|nr:hypothetical protein [Babesia bovis]
MSENIPHNWRNEDDIKEAIQYSHWVYSHNLYDVFCPCTIPTASAITLMRLSNSVA